MSAGAGFILRGILRAFDAGTYTATVEVVGSYGYVLSGVLVARDIAAGEMTAGRVVMIAAADATSPTDMMVVGVW